MTSLAAIRSALRQPPTRRSAPPWPLLGVAATVAALALIPLAYLVLRAVDGGSSALEALLRPRTLELIVSTFVLGNAVILGSVALGVPLAWLTMRTDLPARRAWSVLAIAPLAVPSYLLAFAFVGALAPRGWLGGLGLPSVYGFWGAALVLSLATMPYVVIATRAALARLDPATEEAARSLGRGPWAAARTAILPVLLPAIGAGALLACLYAISDFGAVSILRYDTLATAIYSQYRFSFDRSSAAGLALLLLVVARGRVGAGGRIRRRAALNTPHGRRRLPAPVALGRWRIPAMLFCGSIALLALGIPVITIGVWLADGLRAGLPFEVGLDALRDSVLLAGGAALVAALLALPLARLITHFRGRASTLTDRLLYAVYAIPSISLALAIVFFTLNALPLLYQTAIVLVLAIGLRYLVQAVGAMRGPMLQVSPRTVEAARSLGEGSVGVMRTVTLPLLRPGIVAGFMLVLLSGLKELPLTLLLAPPGTSTLATELWDAAREAFYAQAAVPAGLLLMVSLLSVALLVRRGEIEA
ncbi:MAG: iron ABC transporter permease [Candidatus Limnocylindrales bacterium]